MKKYIGMFAVLLTVILSVSCEYITDLEMEAGLTDGLVAYWPVVESTGTATIKDYSGNGNDLTVSGTRTFSSGIHSTAVVFNGSAPNAAILSSTNILKNKNTFSISFWIKGSLGGMAPIIITPAFSLSTDSNFDLGLSVLSGSAPYPKAEYYPQWIADGEWKYVTGTYDQKFISLYINGIQIATYECSLNLNQVNSIIIFTDTSVYLSGTIDEIRIYNRALSEDEIKKLMTVGVK